MLTIKEALIALEEGHKIQSDCFEADYYVLLNSVGQIEDKYGNAAYLTCGGDMNEKNWKIYEDPIVKKSTPEEVSIKTGLEIGELHEKIRHLREEFHKELDEIKADIRVIILEALKSTYGKHHIQEVMKNIKEQQQIKSGQYYASED